MKPTCQEAYKINNTKYLERTKVDYLIDRGHQLLAYLIGVLAVSSISSLYNTSLSGPIKHESLKAISSNRNIDYSGLGKRCKGVMGPLRLVPNFRDF